MINLIEYMIFVDLLVQHSQPGTVVMCQDVVGSRSVRYDWWRNYLQLWTGKIIYREGGDDDVLEGCCRDAANINDEETGGVNNVLMSNHLPTEPVAMDYLLQPIATTHGHAIKQQYFMRKRQCLKFHEESLCQRSWVSIVVLSHCHRFLLLYYKYNFWKGAIPVE